MRIIYAAGVQELFFLDWGRLNIRFIPGVAAKQSNEDHGKQAFTLLSDQA